MMHYKNGLKKSNQYESGCRKRCYLQEGTSHYILSREGLFCLSAQFQLRGGDERHSTTHGELDKAVDEQDKADGELDKAVETSTK